ncbi:MAG: hypothetical protein WBX05_17870 [Pseudolabrys sp.]
MSTPIQQDELSPDDPKYYAPPKWRSGEIEAPPIQPRLRSDEVPTTQVSIHRTSRQVDMLLTNAFPKSRRHSDEFEYNRVRMTALVSAVGVIVWTGFCITAALGRLDATNFAQFRDGLVSANRSEILKTVPVAAPSAVSVGERLQAANTALSKVSPQFSAPTFVVEDVGGIMNAALPLAIKVTNYTPNTTINLSGFVVGTMLSLGAEAGPGQWRVSIDDLPNARVIPPPDYVGPMTVAAELRGGDDQAIVRTSLRLVWRAAAADSTGALEPRQSDAFSSALDDMASKQIELEQFAAPQDDLAVTPPRRLKAGKHSSSVAKANSVKNHRLAKRRWHRNPLSDPELQYVDSRGELRPSLSYNLFESPRERRAFWTDDPDAWGRKR